jgi:hypothetical protein
MPNEGMNGWNEYKQRVLFQLDELSSLSKEMNKKLDDLKTEVTILKVKSAMYGSIAGVVVSFIVALAVKFL